VHCLFIFVLSSTLKKPISIILETKDSSRGGPMSRNPPPLTPCVQLPLVWFNVPATMNGKETNDEENIYITFCSINNKSLLHAWWSFSWKWWEIFVFSFQYLDILVFSFQYLNISIFNFQTFFSVFSIQTFQFSIFKISDSFQTFHKEISNFTL
jgi:hypothetical protein